MQLVGVVFYELAEVDLEMAVVPVRITALVHLSVAALWPSSGSVSLESYGSRVYHADFSRLVVCDLADDLLLGVAVPVECLEQTVPLAFADINMHLGQDGSVIEICNSVSRSVFVILFRRLYLDRSHLAGCEAKQYKYRCKQLLSHSLMSFIQSIPSWRLLLSVKSQYELFSQVEPYAQSAG